jgi:hypothetical protein
MGKRNSKTGDSAETRADRLARALRDNLRRRKSQERARSQADGDTVQSNDIPHPGDDAGAESD